MTVIGPVTMKDEAKDGDTLVLYLGVAGDALGGTYVRPVQRFLATVEHEGKTVRRFEWQRPRFEVDPTTNLGVVDNNNGRKVVVTCVDPGLAKAVCEDLNTRVK